MFWYCKSVLTYVAHHWCVCVYRSFKGSCWCKISRQPLFIAKYMRGPVLSSNEKHSSILSRCGGGNFLDKADTAPNAVNDMFVIFAMSTFLLLCGLSLSPFLLLVIHAPFKISVLSRSMWPGFSLQETLIVLQARGFLIQNIAFFLHGDYDASFLSLSLLSCITWC